MHITLLFTNHKCIKCIQWMPKLADKKSIARQLVNHSMVSPSSPLRLWIPTPCPPPVPIPEGSSFSGGPKGSEGGGMDWGRHFFSPSLLLPGLPGETRTCLNVKRQRWALGKELLVLSHSLPQIQSDDPNHKQLPPSSQRTSQRGRVGKGSERKRSRCHSGFIFFFP